MYSFVHSSDGRSVIWCNIRYRVKFVILPNSAILRLYSSYESAGPQDCGLPFLWLERYLTDNTQLLRVERQYSPLRRRVGQTVCYSVPQVI